MIKTAMRQKEDGNLKFKAKKMKEAEGHYREALMNLDHVKNLTEDLKKLKITCYQNCSLVLNSCNEFKESIRLTTLAINLDSSATKALYIRATAHKGCKNFDEGIADMKAAIKLEP